VVLYLPNSNADGFVTKNALTNGKAEHIVSLLVKEKALPEGCALLDFSITGGGGCKANMNAAYGTALNTTGTTGEYIYLGTVVNTLLTYFKMDTITITVEGQPLSTGHGGTINEPVSFYGDQTSAPGGDVNGDELADAIANLPRSDAAGKLWNIVDGYWNTSDGLFFAFLRNDAVPGAAYGPWDTENRGFGYFVGANPTGRFTAELTIRFLPTEGTLVSEPLPNKLVTVEIDMSSLDRDGKINIRIEDQGNGGWYTYAYGGKTQEEAYANRG